MNGIITALRELVSALDRRVPHADRPNERRIAAESQVLRRNALARIDALSRDDPAESPYNQGLADAVMTDDGSPHPGGRGEWHPGPPAPRAERS